MTKFKQLQTAAGITNEQCAEYLDIGVSSVKRYKSGERPAPAWVLLALESLVKDKPACAECGAPTINKCQKTPSRGWGPIKCGKPLCAKCNCNCDKVFIE